MSYTDFLRRFSVVGSSTCYVEGTVKLDLKTATTAGAYSAELLKNGAFLNTSTFTLSTSDNIYTQRQLDIKMFKTATLDMSTYTIGGKPFATALLHVFGSGKSNMAFASLVPTFVSSTLVDAGNDAKLDASVLNFNISTQKADFDLAFHKWFDNLYSKHGLGASYSNKTVAVEVNFVKSYDIANNVLASDNMDFLTWADKGVNQGNTLGKTYEKDGLFVDFHSGIVIFRKNLTNLKNSYNFNADVTVDGLVLRTLCHEIGHAWVENDLGGTGVDCPYHTSYDNGYNTSQCLWQTCNKSASQMPAYINNSITNPLFCEGHQQIFMNQLRPKP